MADLEKIAEELSALTVIEASELSKLLEEKWGVSAAAPVAMAAVAPGATAGGDAAEDSRGRPLFFFLPHKILFETLSVPIMNA